MAQVNIDVAKESSILSINDTITNNVADKQTLTNVSNKIGNFTEGGSLETLVASLSQQVESLQTELAVVKGKVESSGQKEYRISKKLTLADLTANKTFKVYCPVTTVPDRSDANSAAALNKPSLRGKSSQIVYIDDFSEACYSGDNTYISLPVGRIFDLKVSGTMTSVLGTILIMTEV